MECEESTRTTGDEAGGCGRSITQTHTQMTNIIKPFFPLVLDYKANAANKWTKPIATSLASSKRRISVSNTLADVVSDPVLHTVIFTNGQKDITGVSSHERPTKVGRMA